MPEELIGKSSVQGYLLLVETEEKTGDVGVPAHPVEDGLALNDHVERQPFGLSLTGKLIRPTNDRLERLIQVLEGYRDKGTIVSYEGRRIYQNMLIEKFTYRADKSMKNGYTFTMSLRQVRVADSPYIAPTPQVKAQVKKTSEAGRKQTENKKTSPVYHVVKKGDTYYALGLKYGTPWPQLETWNSYPPRSIPIGVKLRVK